MQPRTARCGSIGKFIPETSGISMTLNISNAFPCLPSAVNIPPNQWVHAWSRLRRTVTKTGLWRPFRRLGRLRKGKRSDICQLKGLCASPDRRNQTTIVCRRRCRYTDRHRPSPIKSLAFFPVGAGLAFLICRSFRGILGVCFQGYFQMPLKYTPTFCLTQLNGNWRDWTIRKG